MLLLLLSLIAAFAIGANNASACIGAIVGAGLMDESKALLLAGIGIALGIFLEGWKMKPSILKYMINSNDPKIAACLLIASLIVLSIVTFFALPLSFSQALVGGAIGIGIVTGNLNWGFAGLVSLSWLYAPLVSIPVAGLIYLVLRRILPRGIFNRAQINAILVVLSSFYVAYVLGANTVGLLEGMTESSDAVSGPLLAISAFLGSYIGGKTVTNTVSQDIVGISPIASAGASFSGALIVEIMTQLAIPVSVSQIGVAALFGPALARKITISNHSKIIKIVLIWAIAPLIGMVLALAFYAMLPNSIYF